jgi:phosphoglycolate phosphatase-like HAD superfamily hydrolase
MAIVSGWIGTAQTRELLQRNGLERCFELVLTADDLVSTEPVRDYIGAAYLNTKEVLVAQAVKDLGAEPAHTMIIGDSPEDVRAGARIRARTVAVQTGNGDKMREAILAAAPHEIIGSVADLRHRFEISR